MPSGLISVSPFDFSNFWEKKGVCESLTVIFFCEEHWLYLQTWILVLWRAYIYTCDFSHVKFCKSFLQFILIQKSNIWNGVLEWLFCLESIMVIMLSICLTKLHFLQALYVFPAGLGCSGLFVLEFLKVYSNLISHLSQCWLVGVSLPYNSEQELSRFSSWHQTKFIVLKNFKYGTCSLPDRKDFD